MLLDDWGLTFKPSSKLILVPKGSAEDCTALSPWTVVTSMPCLGHLLDHDGSVKSCYQSASRSAWRAFWANPGSHRSVSIGHRMVLLNRAVLPVLEYRFSRWPLQVKIEKELGTLQRKMVTILHREPMLPSDSWASWARRRAGAVTELIREHGDWCDKWRTRFTKWNNHLNRHEEEVASTLLVHRGASWLENRRAGFAPCSTERSRPWTRYAGRTDTRAIAGFVYQRWQQAFQSVLS